MFPGRNGNGADPGAGAGAGPETGGAVVDTSTLATAGDGSSMPLSPTGAIAPAVSAPLPVDTGNPLQNFINWWENELAQIWASFGQAFAYTPAQVQQAAGRSAAAVASGANNPMFMSPVYTAANPFTISPGTGTVVPPAAARDSAYLAPELPGVGQYIPTQSYMMTPAGQAGIRGLGGGLGCGCGCGAGLPVGTMYSCGCSQPGGMGTLGDGTGLFGSGLFNGSGVAGSGLFEGGFDPSTWGPAEWAVLAIGGYVVWSVFFTTKAAVGYAASVPARTKRAARGVKSSFL